MQKRFFLLVTILLLSLPTTLLAAKYDQFQRDSVEAYHFYKKSVALTSKADQQAKAMLAVEKFLSSWKILASKYQQDVPEPFAAQPDFAKLINQPMTIAQQAFTELQQGQIAAAHSTLEEIRYLLWKMRTDAGLITLSDKVNDFHETMEVVLDKMHADKSSVNFPKISKRYGPWLAIKWQELANSKVFNADQSAFEEALNNGRKAIDELRSHLANGEVNSANAAGKKMKKAYKAIFFLDSAS